MSKVKKIIIAALIFVVLAIVAMIPIPYVIESPGTAEEVSQFFKRLVEQKMRTQVLLGC